jgi:MOSC domain-containing protein YiiM
MKLLSIQIGLPREVEWQGKKVSTGIFKDAVSGPVRVGRLNLEGDGQADLRVHGGPDKAVYAYSADAYPWWKRELAREELPNGSFGENLTVDALDESALCLGDVVAIGEARLQVAQPRLPCFKLGIRLGLTEAPEIFMRSGRPGIYFRVLAEGAIRAGDRLVVEAGDPERVPLVSLFELYRTKRCDPAWAERALRVKSLMPNWRGKIAAAMEEQP